jgi:DNA-binding MarR family transcriptional regulator
MVAKGDIDPCSTARQSVGVTYLVKQLELAVRQGIDRSVRRYGLTTPQYNALSVLGRHPGMSSAQLARRSFVTPQAANEMVSALERKGLIVRHADARNHRVLELRLTSAGATTLELCNDDVAELEGRMLADVSPEAAAQLRALLEACLAAVRDIPTVADLPAQSAS